MRDNNFFATKTLACGGTKTWPITIYLHQNIHVRHENLAANSGQPWTIDARTLHYSYCKLFIYHSIYTILQRTPTILLHRTNCTQQRNATYRLYSFGNIISFHHICVCLYYWHYSISIMSCLGQSFVSPNRPNSLAYVRFHGLFWLSQCCPFKVLFETILRCINKACFERKLKMLILCFDSVGPRWSPPMPYVVSPTLAALAWWWVEWYHLCRIVSQRSPGCAWGRSLLLWLHSSWRHVSQVNSVTVIIRSLHDVLRPPFTQLASVSMAFRHISATRLYHSLRPCCRVQTWILLNATRSYLFTEFQDEHAKPIEEDRTLLR